MWKIVNSPFVVAIMIAVMGWFGGEAFLRIAEEGRIQRENNLVTERMKTEIAYRATRTKEYLENIIRYKTNGDDSRLLKATSELLLQLAGKESNSGWPANLFSDYADQNTASLLSQLTLLSKPDSDVQRILNEAVASTVELQNMGADIHSHEPKTTIPKLIEGTKRQLESLAKVTGKSYLTNGENSD